MSQEWTKNLRELRYETIHYSRGLDELVKSLDEKGNKALYQMENGEVYELSHVRYGLRQMQESINKDDYGRNEKLADTRCWNSYRNKFTIREGIREAIGNVPVHTNENSIITSHPEY